jgi:SpoVK/Ycf46/Vps4 family AAA+-type ATPase
MTMPVKPILYNGFKVKSNVTVKNRIERIFFTEIYLLSNNQYLYIFTNINSEKIIDRGGKYDLLTFDSVGKKYLGVIIKEYSHKKVTAIIDDLTILHGFDCVAGMKKLKTLLINDVIEPLINPEKFKKFKLSIPNGILLYGPPGCGKTFIVKKLAEELDYNFIELNPSSVATNYIHGAVGNIGKVFKMAKLQAPSIIFIDEIEGLMPRREDLSSNADIKKEEVSEFLLQLNNAGENNILVVGATNKPHMIDSAILRSGRMDKRIYISAPDYDARKELFKIYLSGIPCDKGINLDKLAEMTDKYVSSDIELIVKQSARIAVAKNKNMIDKEMLIESINKCSPSISLEEIQYYEQFGDMERW